MDEQAIFEYLQKHLAIWVTTGPRNIGYKRTITITLKGVPISEAHFTEGLN